MLYRERLTVPPAWWALAGLLALTLLFAIGLYLGPVWGIGVAAAALAIATGLFAGAAITIRVDQQVVQIGRSVIERRYVGAVASLDAEQTRRRGGVEADARAHLVLRPYVATAVEIVLDDDADSVPYWLVSSRRPAQLAAALQAGRA